MRDGRTLLLLQKKQQSLRRNPKIQMRAVFVPFISLKFQSVISAEKNKYISTENLFKIPQRAGVAKIPLVDLLKIHLGVEVDPQDGKSSRVCFKCALKIRNASTLCEFIRTALNCENTDEESQGEQRLKRMNIVSPQRNIKKRLQSSSSKHHYPGKTPRIYRQRKGRCSSSTQISSQKLRRYIQSFRGKQRRLQSSLQFWTFPLKIQRFYRQREVLCLSRTTSRAFLHFLR